MGMNDKYYKTISWITKHSQFKKKTFLVYSFKANW